MTQLTNRAPTVGAPVWTGGAAPLSSRLEFTHALPRARQGAFAESVNAGFADAQRWLSCSWFYDERGSELFEEICELPEYYLTRTERMILERHAPAIAASMPRDTILVELGSGSSVKTRLLIEAFLDRQSHLTYCPIDISDIMLRSSAEDLLRRYHDLSIRAVAADYEDGLEIVGVRTRSPRLFLFLGSTIGNFDPESAIQFLGKVRRSMGPADAFLLGADLAKSPQIIEPAYNDPSGVTAAFNKNILARINRELGGCFDLNMWEHHAPYLPEAGRVEMRLVSRIDQISYIEALHRSFQFSAEEYIHTESCYKYSEAQLKRLAGAAGFREVRAWCDPFNWFTLSLLVPDSETES